MRTENEIKAAIEELEYMIDQVKPHYKRVIRGKIESLKWAIEEEELF